MGQQCAVYKLYAVVKNRINLSIHLSLGHSLKMSFSRIFGQSRISRTHANPTPRPYWSAHLSLSIFLILFRKRPFSKWSLLKQAPFESGRFGKWPFRGQISRRLGKVGDTLFSVKDNPRRGKATEPKINLSNDLNYYDFLLKYFSHD